MKLSDLKPRVVLLLGSDPDDRLTDEQRRALLYARQRKWRAKNREKRNQMEKRWRTKRANNPRPARAEPISRNEEAV